MSKLRNSGIERARRIICGYGYEGRTLSHLQTRTPAYTNSPFSSPRAPIPVWLDPNLLDTRIWAGLHESLPETAGRRGKALWGFHPGQASEITHEISCHRTSTPNPAC